MDEEIANISLSHDERYHGDMVDKFIKNINIH